MSDKPGRNVALLITRKMAVDAIPAGGGLQAGVEFLSSAENIKNGFRAAQAWVREAIAAVKAASDNPWGDDDEAIAGEILRQLEAKQGRTA